MCLFIWGCAYHSAFIWKSEDYLKGPVLFYCAGLLRRCLFPLRYLDGPWLTFACFFAVIVFLMNFYLAVFHLSAHSWRTLLLGWGTVVCERRAEAAVPESSIFSQVLPFYAGKETFSK